MSAGDEDAYSMVNASSLRLKRGSNGDVEEEEKRRKRKKKKRKKKEEEIVREEVAEQTNQPTTSSLTKAETSFLSRKRHMDEQRIREKAKISHKERVEKFNEYLNNLSEHYEPAKVSWTK